MNSPIVYVIVFALLALAALLGLWWYARQLKQDLDSHAAVVAGVRCVIELTPASVSRLRELSSEPILLRQSEEGVRIQVEHRPMLPMMAFAGMQLSGALGEATALITERYGVKWVVLMSAGEDGRVVVERLA
jgi:hypothetical protein